MSDDDILSQEEKDALIKGVESGDVGSESADPVSYTHLTLPTICSV